MNRKLQYISVLAFVLLLSLVCSPLLASPAHGQSNSNMAISITVENSWMSRLDNTAIYMDGIFQGVTDTRGNFLINGYVAGHHNITAVKAGYDNSSVEKDFNGPDALEIKLNTHVSTTAVTIIVEDDRVSRSKISGANVYVDGVFAG